MKIKFLDLKTVNSIYADELKKEAAEVIDSGWFLNGTKLEKFEKKFSQYINRKYSLFVNSGSSANLIMLSALIESKRLKNNRNIPNLIKKGSFKKYKLSTNNNHRIFVKDILNNYKKILSIREKKESAKWR